MRRWWPSLCVPVALACQSPKPEGEAGPAPSSAPSAQPSVPRVYARDQRGVKSQGAGSGVLPGVAGETDGREIAAGKSFHAEAKKGCADTQCVGNNCAKVCAKWTSDNPPSSPDLRNKVYLGCLGSCLTEVDE